MSNRDAIAVTLYNDRTGAESQQNVTPELASLFAYAESWSGEESRARQQAGGPAAEPALSFSSMLAAMAAGPGFLSEWFRGHFALRGVLDQTVTKGRPYKPLPPRNERFTTTHSFRQALAEAAHLADTGPIDLRHFMAAYPIVSDYHREDFLRLRIDRRAWCLDLSEILKERYKEESAKWTAYAALAPAVLLPAFDADLPAGADLLGIAREVEAFAMLIAGRETLTPMSIGVFGSWGSGKSYFMSRVEQRVAALALAGPHEHYYPKIAQVRFNAWHYSESNVVASLVDHIFRNLRFGPGEDEQILAARRKSALAEMAVAEEVRAREERALAEAEAVQRAAQETLARISREVDESVRAKELELARAQAAVAAAQNELQVLLQDQAAALEAARDATPLQQAAGVITGTLLEDPEINRLAQDLKRASDDARWIGLNQQNIVWGVVAIILSALALAALPLIKESRMFVAAVGLVSAFAPIARTWMTTLRDLAAKGAAYQKAVRERTEAAVSQIQAAAKVRIAEEEATLNLRQQAAEKLRSEIAKLQEQPLAASLALADSEQKRAQARESLTIATLQVAQKRSALDAISSGSLLEEIVRDLSTTDSYKKELGTLARARSDFERLSTRLSAARKEYDRRRQSDPTGAGDGPVLDRIVLYIDDLDRCPEEKVREVLRAVHLLLAFDLFVCVVAVDPRWVIQCLRASPGLVSTARENSSDTDLEVLGGAATPSDYLEKIFQIPLWLRPVPSGQRSALIGALLGKHLDREESARAVQHDLENAVRQLQIKVANAVRTSAVAKIASSAAESFSRPPEQIKIKPVELAYLPRLAPLLDGNARALKRYANT